MQGLVRRSRGALRENPGPAVIEDAALMAARIALIDGRREFVNQGKSGIAPAPHRRTACEAHGRWPTFETAHAASLSLMKPKPCVPTVSSACSNMGDGGCVG